MARLVQVAIEPRTLVTSCGSRPSRGAVLVSVLSGYATNGPIDYKIKSRHQDWLHHDDQTAKAIIVRQ